MTGIPTFRDKATGVEFFVSSDLERLNAILSPRLTNEPSPEEQREKLEAEAGNRVDAAQVWKDWSALSEGVIATGAKFSRVIEEKRQRYKPEEFAKWLPAAQNDFARALIANTETAKGYADAARSQFPRATIPFSVDNAGIGALSTRLALLDVAIPTEAKPLIYDAKQRGDLAFLAGAGGNIRSYIEYRPSWKSAEGQQIAREMLDVIDAATWTDANAAADRAADRADASIEAWRYLVRTIVQELRLDPMHRQTGALSPLLEPVAK